MRERGDLLEPECAMLREVERDPGDARAISERTNQPYLAVWLVLVRLMARGYLEGTWDHDGRRPRRVYTITAKGKRALTV